ncbi:hypothetical protein SAMN04490202_4843 [Pseudomonas reinekei]|uniref:DUF3077 domain-containing protein n=1 Tax=Pseudomonas reinekei TaxID=395598 RepID=A0A1H0TNX1_PSERE|nr:DUF6124 family protein [Pseudomonas reinekei]KAB0481038.1 hypothetical protein F7R15_26525 [Pseudomonas reinekei]OLT99612.1 hypothetical protein BVK86_25380 [Pseudomonas reinekei]SDP55633.1 hypothetical protein SAMN04490202_4843 [Pseudomonas reinekei]
MCKPTPPNTDPIAPNENLHSQKNQEHIDHILSATDIRATPRTLCTMYVIDPQIDVETLLGDACESLASAHVMTLDLADRTEGSSRNTLLGIAQVIMLGELAVNRALDRIDPPA